MSRRASVAVGTAALAMLSLEVSSQKYDFADDDYIRKASAERFLTLHRAYELKRRREDAKLRDDNITDNEVREVQTAVRPLDPHALVNISGVTEGCPCEEGQRCSSQVWVVVAYRPGKSIGLSLSKIHGRWVIGAVQQWWLAYESLERQRQQFKSQAAYLEAKGKLIDAFPRCEAPSSSSSAQHQPVLGVARQKR